MQAVRKCAIAPREAVRIQQILTAAETCFRRNGFHAASMGMIAKEARLSVGQIYRYFANKEAIVAAIIKRDMQAMAAGMRQLDERGGDPVAAISSHFSEELNRLASPEHAALVLEIMAEAARNAKMMAIVRAAEKQWRVHTRNLLVKNAKHEWPAADIEARLEVVSLLFEGLRLRAVHNPSLEHDSLERVLHSVIAHLFELPKGK